jgi:ubiquinone/menaquinone biosynthesis C-methylase UbiE
VIANPLAERSIQLHERDRMRIDSQVSKILDLSRRVSVFSPAMKPFVRFASEKPGYEFCQRHLWDFDDLLQKELLRLLRLTVSPEAITRACIRQWKQNSQSLRQAGRLRLESGNFDVDEPPYAASRRNILLEHLDPDSRVLYIGCGTGRDCLAWAKDRLRMVGIDTDTALVRFAREWNDRLGYSAAFAGMDMMHLGLRDRSVDGFLLELYGGLPDVRQGLVFQRELHRVLRPDGIGLVVAERKMYACWWFLMPTSWPDSMVKWLQGQVRLDFRFVKKDACEERLQYGLFSRCHTEESLSAELSRTFEILSCRYQNDPRYVLAVVRKKEGVGGGQTEEGYAASEAAPVDLSEMEAILEDAEMLCKELEWHAEAVASFFKEGGRGADCLTELRPSAEAVLHCLGQLLGPNDTSAGPSLTGEDDVPMQRSGKGGHGHALAV